MPGHCGYLHGGVESAALSGNLTAVVHNRMFYHFCICDRQAAVGRYLRLSHWRMEESTSVLPFHTYMSICDQGVALNPKHNR